MMRPVNTVLPVVSGTIAVGSRLTATKGTWKNLPTSYRYKWVKAKPVTHRGLLVTHKTAPVHIGLQVRIGVNANSYLLTAAERGFLVGCVVTAANAAGTASAASKMTVIIR